jgi:thiol-disulfide isomerase/thioredoxin
MSTPDDTVFGPVSRGIRSRRAVLGSIGGLLAGVSSASGWSTDSIDNPPPLNNARHQFEIIVPSGMLPSVASTGLDGKPAKFAPTPGRVLLVNLWATWCDLCRTELPLLDRFQQAAGASVDVVAVSTDKIPSAQVKGFLDRLRIRHLRVLLDPDEQIASDSQSREPPLRIYGMPNTYLITPSGRIAGNIAGATDWLAPDARQLLAYYSTK